MSDSTLAILGGSKACDIKPAAWPVFCREEEEALAAVVRSGAWYEHVVLGANHRLSEFQGAVLNCQLDRLEEQTVTRDRNGAHLAARLAQIPGLRPQVRKFPGMRHAYHIFALRYDPSVYGVSREIFLRALNAEGVAASGGYPLPLYRQRMFREKNFGPYTGYRLSRPGLDYARTSCPVCERICREEGIWLGQRLFLGSRGEMDRMADAFAKLYEQRQALADYARRAGGTAA